MSDNVSRPYQSGHPKEGCQACAWGSGEHSPDCLNAQANRCPFCAAAVNVPPPQETIHQQLYCPKCGALTGWVAPLGR